MLAKYNKVFVLVICLISILFSTGCSTIQGIGRDIESVGNSLENAAERASN